jgi:hypothetical protein
MGVDPGDVHQDAGDKACAFVRSLVVPQSQLIFSAAVEEIKYGARQSPFGSKPQVFDGPGFGCVVRHAA